MLEILQWKQQHKKQVWSHSIEEWHIHAQSKHRISRKINKRQIVIGAIEAEQDPMVLVCRKTLISLIREVRKCRTETKESSQTRPNINSLVIKHSRGLLVPPQGL